MMRGLRRKILPPSSRYVFNSIRKVSEEFSTPIFTLVEVYAADVQ